MEGKENKANGINMVLVVIIVILLGIVGYCAYRLGDTGRSVIDDENLQKGGNTSVPVDVEEDKDEKEETVAVPTELDDNTINMLDIAVKNGQFFKYDDNRFIFNSIIETLLKNNKSVGFSEDHNKYGSIYKINKNDFGNVSNFFSKKLSMNEIIELQNDRDVNSYGYYIENNGEVITLIAGGHGDISINKEIINKVVINDQLVITYKTTCWNSEKENSIETIGETTVYLDYVDGKFSLNHIELKNGQYTCEQT